MLALNTQTKEWPGSAKKLDDGGAGLDVDIAHVATVPRQVPVPVPFDVQMGRGQTGGVTKRLH